jgi:hypothetical protein
LVDQNEKLRLLVEKTSRKISELGPVRDAVKATVKGSG